MRKALAMVFFLALPGQSELQQTQILPSLPSWADPAPREVLSNPILDSIDNVVLNTWALEPAPFSDWVLAAILSRTPIRS